MSTLPEVTHPAISRAGNTTKIKGFLVPGGFLVDCKNTGGLPEHL